MILNHNPSSQVAYAGKPPNQPPPHRAAATTHSTMWAASAIGQAGLAAVRAATTNRTDRNPPAPSLLDKAHAHIKISREELCPKGTQKEYQRIQREYLEYVFLVHGDTSKDSSTVTVDRATLFLTYSSLRPRRPKSQEAHKFSKADYNEVMGKLRTSSESPAPHLTPSIERNLKSLDTYYAAILDLASDEMKLKLQQCTHIKNLRKQQAPKRFLADIANFEELNHSEIEALEMVHIFEDLEDHFWQKHANLPRSKKLNWGRMASSLRDRFCLLDSAANLTRGETYWNARLVDMYYTSHKVDEEPHAYPLLFRQINEGKTNGNDKGKALTARAMRHKNPKLCCHGALAYYLFARFNFSGEKFDLSSNPHWYEIKTIVATGDTSHAFDNTKGIHKNTYTDALAAAFKRLAISLKKKGHIGRSLGPGLLQLEEVCQLQIKELGRWMMDVFERHYSNGIPFPAMRVAAGFKKERGSFFMPRSMFEPSQELKDMVFPNIKDAQRAFSQLPQETQVRLKGARDFLRSMDYLASVFLQDSAFFMSSPTDGEGRYHALFEAEIFKTPQYQEFYHRFVVGYVSAIRPENNPTIDPIKKAMPSLAHTLVSVQNQVGSVAKNVINSSLTAQQNSRHLHQLHSDNERLRQYVQKRDYQWQQYILNCTRAMIQVPVATESPEQSETNTACPMTVDNPFGSPTPTPVGAARPPFTVTPSEPPKPIYPAPSQHYYRVTDILSDFHGDMGSEYFNAGGLRSLSTDRMWTNNLSASEKKRVNRIVIVGKFAMEYEDRQRPGDKGVIEKLVEIYGSHHAKKGISSVSLGGLEMAIKKHIKDMKERGSTS